MSTEQSIVPTADAGEQAYVDFAHTCNGYAVYGGPEELADLVRTVQSGWERDGSLPGDLLTLRCCLFYEVRAHRHSGGYRAFDEDAFVRALMSGIRELSGGTVARLWTPRGIE